MLALDIGGSFIKYALTGADGTLLPGTAGMAPSDAEGSYEDVLGALTGVIRACREKQAFSDACVSIAGPFDYERGVSLMQHKFKAIYQKSLTGPFEEAGVSVRFLHDSTAFILGAVQEQGFGRYAHPACVMLGTGLGFSFMRGGRVCVNERRTPALALWSRPWRGGIAEDAVSTRAIRGLYGTGATVKEIADLARAGDEKAADVFRQVGASLSDLMAEVLPGIGADSFMLGGQIAKAADLMDLRIGVPWTVTEHPEDAALRGVGVFAVRGKDACEALTPDPLGCGA